MLCSVGFELVMSLSLVFCSLILCCSFSAYYVCFWIFTLFCYLFWTLLSFVCVLHCCVVGVEEPAPPEPTRSTEESKSGPKGYRTGLASEEDNMHLLGLGPGLLVQKLCRLVGSLVIRSRSDLFWQLSYFHIQNKTNQPNLKWIKKKKINQI